MTYRNVRNQLPPSDYEGDFEDYIKMLVSDGLTAIPKGWEPVQEYNNRGRPEDDCVIRDAGWCPVCKEKLDDCACTEVKDIFDNAEDD